MKVAVVMSTYNGDKYLAEQLDSILAQTGVSVSLFVRDDGSTDGTRAILAEYAETHGNVSVDFAQNVGVGNSFMNALYAVPDTFDYYAFADQDDIWLENKLIEAITLLRSSGKALYASNQENVDKDGNSLGMRYGDDADIHLTPVSIISNNTVAGCTFVFTRELYGRLTAAECRPTAELLKNRIHDVWVAAAAAVNGGIVYDPRSFINYRQHGNNVVGSFKPSFKKRMKERLRKVKDKGQRNGRCMLARELVRCYGNAADFPLVEVCAKARKTKLLKHGGELRSYTGEGAFAYFIKVLLGLF